MIKKGVFILAILGLSASSLLAHPPKNNEMTFNRGTLTLSVKALHAVSDPAKHYVKSIRVLVNGQTIATKTFDRQLDPGFQEGEFKFDPAVVSLPQGAELTVISECSVYGKKKTTISLDS